jgi:RNA polymerase sigma factor (TIGR02999 family)
MAMQRREDSELTELLNLGFRGDATARDRAFALVYDELRRTAAAQMGFGRDNATLSPTGLVNEAYLKLVSGAQLALNDRTHFFALAARAMRQLLIDQQRQKLTEKHGGGLRRVELSQELPDDRSHPLDYLDLDRALAELERVDPRAAQVVELHFFAGLNFMEIAEMLAVSDKTARRDWNSARAFLLTCASAADAP